MPNPAWSILGNRRKMKVVRRPLMLHIKGCEASCPCMLHLFLDMWGRVRESHVNCGWWCHLPWACSCLPVCVLFCKNMICFSGVVSNTGVWACVMCVDHGCSCPGVLVGTWGKFSSYFTIDVCVSVGGFRFFVTYLDFYVTLNETEETDQSESSFAL